MGKTNTLSNTIGFDFGTNNTVLAYHNKVLYKNVVATNLEGSGETPSAIYVKENGERIYGRKAKESAPIAPGRVITSPKSELGKGTVTTKEGLTYDVNKEITGFLKNYREDMTKSLDPDKSNNFECKSAIITHPVYWNELQIQQYKKIVKDAGFEVTATLLEPAAPALEYYNMKEFKGKGRWNK